MDTESLSYDLPDAAIAQSPATPRDAARLLVDRGPGAPAEHRTVADLPGLLAPGDVLVVNDTRVIPARLHLHKPTGGAVEVLLLERRPEGHWEALVRPSRRVPDGTVLGLDGQDVRVEVGRVLGADGRRQVTVHGDGDDDLTVLARYGEVPLPPYIHEPLADPERYQTVFARSPGSVAAPTAGLHLTDAVLDECRAKGVVVATVDLVVGLGTFRPITVERVEDHPMHAERYRVPVEAQEAVTACQGQVVAVGTTVTRALESWAATGEAEGSTDLFIHGDFRFAVVERLLTNFHVPRSSLLALVEAFAGPRWKDLYRTALADGYRFLSFGDAMLLDRSEGQVGVKLHIDVTATDGPARTGTITTPRGVLPTPLFMPVGTKASVKALDTEDLDAMGIPLVLANTYHLMLRPGEDVIADLGGLHRFTSWDGHVLTDSGGFQIFSLEPKVDDRGARFRSTYDGSTHHLTPEGAAEIQSKLGADIQMVLDVCPPLPSTDRVVRAATERTRAWGLRGRKAFLDGASWRLDRGLDQAQFGIAQGGIDLDLRRQSAADTVATGFDGYAIGGLSVGETREEMLPALAAALHELPADQPRYLMGVGDPASIVEAVGLGVDLFDCVLPSRHARHGTVLTSQGRLMIKNLASERDEGPLDPTCSCRVCARYSRAYLRHLHRLGEPTAARLLTIHNVTWLSDLVVGLRAAIVEGRFDQARRAVLDVWG